MLNAFSTLSWREPLWLWLLLQPFLLWLILRWLAKRKQQRFADPHLLPWITVSNSQTFWGYVFSRDSAYVIGWFFLIIALAGPQTPRSANEPNNNTVLDMMVVADLSDSMRARDIQPSRLRRETLELFELSNMLKNSRLGITVFAARPHLFVPLTSDLNALRFYLKDLDNLTLPTRGSDPAAAIKLATQELIAAQGPQQKVLLLLSDGDFQADQIPALKQAIVSAQEHDIKTYILGIGTRTGSAVPLTNGNWLEAEGQGIISKLNRSLLQHLSQLGQGAFSVVSDDDQDWQTLYKKGILKNLQDDAKSTHQQWKTWYQPPLFLGTVLLFFAFFPTSLKSLKQMTVAMISVLFIFLVLDLNTPLYAAEKHYQTTIQDGISAYRAANYNKAMRSFIDAVLLATTQKERATALHNLGNTLFKKGDFAQAAELFTDALRYNPEQKASTDNQRLALAIYKLLEKRRNRNQKQGNFATPNDTSPLFDLPDQIPFMLDTKAVNLLKIELPKLSKDVLKTLSPSDIQQLELLQSERQESIKKEQDNAEIAQAKIHFMGLHEKKSVSLWKRLFEIEEGFPGEVTKPEKVPGLRPW